MKIDLSSDEFPPWDTYKLCRGHWEAKSEMPDMWVIMHQCKNIGFDIDSTELIVDWYIFLKQHKTATLEELLQKLEEGRKKKDYYDFSKYCLERYRKVHEMQQALDLNYIEKKLLKTIIKGTEEGDRYGDELYADQQNKYWQRRATIAAPDDRELPRAYVKLRDSYKSFAEFMRAHKEYKKPEDPFKEDTRWAVINSRLRNTSEEVRSSLER